MSNAIEKNLNDNGVLKLSLNRPDVLNAMNADLIMGLLDGFNEAKADKKVRSIIITGNGRGFCSGADLVDGGWPKTRGLTGGEAGAITMENAFNPLVKAITQSTKPVVNAINGMAAGGGVGLALTGDIVVAAESAKFKLVFGPNLGIISDVGASWFVPNLIGRARANGMGLLGEDISAQQGSYSLEWPSGNLNLPVFVDSKAGARGDLNIVDSILPSFVPSQTVTIPNDQTLPNANANANSEAVTFFSSVINTQDSGVLTASIDYENYVGNVTLQGSTLVDSDYYDINQYRYGNAANGNSESSTIGYTMTGYHPFIRIKFEANVGNIVTLLAR